MVVPVGLRKGRVRITVATTGGADNHRSNHLASTSVQVEDYKRPKFKVELKAYSWLGLEFGRFARIFRPALCQGARAVWEIFGVL